MTIAYDEGTLRFRAVMAPEFQRIFDYLAPYSDDPWDLVLIGAMDYYPANSLYGLSVEAEIMGVVIPENLFADAERAVAEDGFCEDYMLNSFRQYREEHYPAAA